MAYEMVMPYHLHMPSYFLETFTEYPQTRFKCKLDVKRCKRFVFPPSSLLPRSNALKTKAIRYFQTDRTLTRIVSPPLPIFTVFVV